MDHKKTVYTTRKFLKRVQAWVDKTPGAESVSTKIGSRDIVLAEKNHKCD